MKAIMFEPVEQNTTYVDVADWDAIKELLGCDIMSEMLVDSGEINKGQIPIDVRVVLFHDDEGFLVDENAVLEYSYRDNPHPLKIKLAGTCILAGYWVSEDGENIEILDLDMPLDVADDLVMYLDTRAGDYRINTTTEDGPDGFVVRQVLEEVPRETEDKP